MTMSIRFFSISGMLVLASVVAALGAVPINDCAERSLAEKLIKRVDGFDEGAVSIMKQADAILAVRQVLANQSEYFNHYKIELMSRMVKSGLAVVCCKEIGEGSKHYLFMRLFREASIYDCYRYDAVMFDGEGKLVSFDCDAVIYP